jgi:hypothetical protein
MSDIKTEFLLHGKHRLHHDAIISVREIIGVYNSNFDG